MRREKLGSGRRPNSSRTSRSQQGDVSTEGWKTPTMRSMGSRRVDLGALLEGIKVDDEDEDGGRDGHNEKDRAGGERPGDGGGGGVGGGIAVRPPY